LKIKLLLDIELLKIKKEEFFIVVQIVATTFLLFGNRLENRYKSPYSFSGIYVTMCYKHERKKEDMNVLFYRLLI